MTAPPQGNQPRPTQRPADRGTWRDRTYVVVFESDTGWGKAFDVALIVAILASVAAVMLESVVGFAARYGGWLRAAEWLFTALFTVEYLVRLACVQRPARYARSFFGVIDLLSILPSYLSLFVPGMQALTVVRGLRILRVFRVLKLAHHVHELEELLLALRSSARKITVFVMAVLILVMICGSTMYLVEGPEHGFTSIPRGVYWAVVTLTTVGYGDISPETPLGQALAAFIMIMGYGIIAVPTGIVTVELNQARGVSGRSCEACQMEGHHPEAKFCRRCGAPLA